MFHRTKSKKKRSFVWNNPDISEKINKTKHSRTSSLPFSSESLSNKPVVSQSVTSHSSQHPENSAFLIQKPSPKIQEKSYQDKFSLPNSSSSETLNTNSFLYSSKILSNSNPNLAGLLKRNKPLIHLFVCDYGCAKVKLLADQFIDLLLESGIDVYAEKYMTYQPGFQVRAVSMQTRADFFFQIHCKTATPGYVRLYVSAKPQRMTMHDAIRKIWFCWRMLHGTLNEEEVELLSRDQLLTLLNHFANLNFDAINIEECQHQIQEAIIQGISTKPISQKLRKFESQLEISNNIISNLPIIASTEFVIEEGNIQQNIVPDEITKALSQPLRTLLISIIDQTIQKVKALLKISVRYQTQVAFANEQNFLNVNELEIKNDQENYEIIIPQTESKATVESSWEIIVESFDENRVCSMTIASSFGDECQSSLDRISTPISMDDYNI